MKRLLYLLMAIAFICGCVKTEVEEIPIIPEEKPVVEKEELVVTTLPETLFAYTSGNDGENQTRTVVGGNKVLWNNGDNIFYCTGQIIGAEYKYNGEDAVTKASFDKVGDGKSSEVAATFPVAVFPYRDYFGAKFNINEIKDNETGEVVETDNFWTITPDYEQYQNYIPNSFDKDANIMIATGSADDDNLYFRNACGYVVVRLYGRNVVIDEVRFYANATGYNATDQPRIWGKVHDIDVDSNGNLTFRKSNTANVWGQHIISLNCVDSKTGVGVRISEDPNNPTEFWIALPPMVLEHGVSFSAVDSYHREYANSPKTGKIEIERNKVKRLPAFDATRYDRTNILWYTTTDEQLLSKFDSEKESFKFFDAKIVKHAKGSNDYNKKWMAYIEFDRPLTEIKKGAFEDAGLTEVILPDALVTIGESAFEGNEHLKSITLNHNVTTIGKRAFCDNTNLTECNYSENLTTIGESAFQYTGFTTTTIPGNVTNIGQYAFADCKKLTSVGFEPSATNAQLTIGKGAFQNSGLTYISIPSKVATIEQNAFAKCTNLASVTIDSSNTPLTIGSLDASVSGDHPFYDSNNITTLSLNRELVAANNDMTMALFEDHTMLNSVTFGEQVKTIHSEMFRNTGLIQLTIPGTVNRINWSAFSNCENLTSVTFQPSSTSTPLVISPESKYIDYTPFYGSNNITTLSLNRELAAASNDMTMALFEDHTRLNSVTFGEQVKTIHERMFYNCVGLRSITIPGNVLTIGSSAFKYCNYIENITIEEGPVRERTIKDYAFNNCTGLTSITLNGIANIEEGAFKNCKSLPSIVIPGSVNVIGNNVFDDCTSLRSVTFEGGEGSLIIGYMIHTYAFVGDTDNGPFYQSPLTEINLNRNIVMSDEYANVLDDYDEGIFSYENYNKSGHNTTLKIGSLVKEILPYMFAGSGITSISIPSTIKAVGYNAFLFCNKLKEVNIESGSTTLPFGYQYSSSADWGPFYDSPLEKVTFNRDINLVDMEGKTFNADDWDEGVFATKHSTLQTISIGTDVTKLWPYMFTKSKVTSVWIPHTIKTISDYAFYDCDNLNGVTLGFDGKLDFDRPSIGKDVFDNCYKFKYIKVRNSVHTRFVTSDKNDQWYKYQKYITWGNDFE